MSCKMKIIGWASEDPSNVCYFCDEHQRGEYAPRGNPPKYCPAFPQRLRSVVSYKLAGFA